MKFGRSLYRGPHFSRQVIPRFSSNGENDSFCARTPLRLRKRKVIANHQIALKGKAISACLEKGSCG